MPETPSVARLKAIAAELESIRAADDDEPTRPGGHAPPESELPEDPPTLTRLTWGTRTYNGPAWLILAIVTLVCVTATILATQDALPPAITRWFR